MGKISISLECNSIDEAKALLDFLATYRKDISDKPSEVEDRKVTAEEVNRLTKDVLKDVSENPAATEPPKPVEVDEGKEVTAEDISRFAVSLLRQGKGAKIKRLLGEYDAKAFTDLPKDKMAEFLHILQKI